MRVVAVPSRRGIWRGIAKAILAACALLVIAAAAVLGTFWWQAHGRETKTRVEAAPAGGRFVRAADVEVFVQELGPSGAPVVLFIHGMGAWSELWRDTLAATAAAGFLTVAMDLPPFGYSERTAPGAYGRQHQARRILGVIDALGVQQATLVGHSFGGGPTMEAVLLAPQRVRALVLADAAIGLDAVGGGGSGPAVVLRARPLRNALVAATVTNPLLTRRLLTQFVANPSAVTDARVHLLQGPLVVQGATDAFGDWLFDFLTSREVALSTHGDAYRALALPTLVIWGDRDTTTPLAQGQRLAHLIAGAELAVMPGIGHMPQIEDVAQFNRLVLAFLQKQTR
jgi:pimeloyl-ACP methyl ester carboxylesterase